MKTRLDIAILCWAIPLVLGLGVFGCWLATEEPWLIFAGMGVIGLGCLLFVVGMTALVYLWRHGVPDSGSRSSPKAVLLTAALLFSNFPIAFGLSIGAASWSCRYQISIHNNSSQYLNDIRIFGGGCDIRMDGLGPGESTSRTFWIVNDGTLLLEAKNPTNIIRVQADGYVTNGLGGNTRVTFLPNQTVEVENR